MWATAAAAIAVFCLVEDSFITAAFSSSRHINTRVKQATREYAPLSLVNNKKAFGLPSAATVLLLASSSSSSSSLTLTDRRRLEIADSSLIEIGPLVGCGSYGTVHRVAFIAANGDDDDDDDDDPSSSSSSKSFSFIGKRAWNADDLVDTIMGEATAPTTTSQQQLRDKESRCRYYWNVEAHCFAKLEKKQVSKSTTGTSKNDEQFIKDLVSQRQHVPPFRGVFKDNVHGDEWMVFDLIPGTTTALLEQQQQERNEKDGDLFQPAAPTLQDMMNVDLTDHHLHDEDHHLFFLSQALGLSPPEKEDNEDSSVDNDSSSSSSSSLTKTLDVVIEQVLEILTSIHAQNIVHRDIKPSNILVSSDKQQLFLMDFGSAADLDTIGPGPFAKKIGLMDQRVAISPIYAAPELFINADAGGGGQYAKDVACTFDCFSAGLLFCQLLFQYLDELTDTGFRQQLESAANWNLNVWLQAELASKFRQRNSLQNALQVLAERPGLWSLLQDLLQADPRDRCSSKQALKRWKEIRSKHAAQKTTRREAATTVEDENYVDGAYLQEVLQSMDICIIPEDEITTTANVVSTVSDFVSTTPATISASSSAAPTPSRTDTELRLVLNSRPLQYVATFRRKQSLGLLLAEAFDEENKASPDIMEEMKHESHRTYWQHVVVPQARPGEVYIYGIVPLSQADEMNIFEVGDRLQGVGELPLGDGGFEKVINLLQDQPASATYVTLHFDRKTTALASSAAASATAGAVVTNYNHNETDVQSLLSPFVPSLEGPVQCRDQGAWSSRGRRKVQEDRFILHEVHGTNDQSILIAGVLDGHLGTAASTMVQEELPIVFTEHLLTSKNDKTSNAMVSTGTLLKRAWEQVCEAYQTKCMSNDECAAVYDASEGLLDANTGASDAAAGTTASLMALDKQTGVLTTLNCGDSRCLIFDGDGKLIFQTVDHRPDLAEELERLSEGQKQGLSYSLPECRFSRWYLPVGEYEYAVSRSLEGPFATARGIVYDRADVTDIQVTGIVVAISATDGLFEVMDTAQVGQIVHQLRTTQKMTAADAAKALCSKAVALGSSDNISVVILYLDA